MNKIEIFEPPRRLPPSSSLRLPTRLALEGLRNGPARLSRPATRVRTASEEVHASALYSCFCLAWSSYPRVHQHEPVRPLGMTGSLSLVIFHDEQNTHKRGPRGSGSPTVSRGLKDMTVRLLLVPAACISNYALKFFEVLQPKKPLKTTKTIETLRLNDLSRFSRKPTLATESKT